MKVGLLICDDDPNLDLAEKVIRATNGHKRKFGTIPDVCYVHPSALDGKVQRVGGVRVAALPTVLRHHFWIGMEEKKE